MCLTIDERAEQFKLVVVQLRLLILLLNSEQWRYFPLSVQFLSSEYAPLLCGLPQLPDHVPVTFAPAEVTGRSAIVITLLTQHCMYMAIQCLTSLFSQQARALMSNSRTLHLGRCSHFCTHCNGLCP